MTERPTLPLVSETCILMLRAQLGRFLREGPEGEVPDLRGAGLHRDPKRVGGGRATAEPA